MLVESRALISKKKKFKKNLKRNCKYLFNSVSK